MHFMSTLGHSSAIWAHRAQAQKMMCSHDAKGSLPKHMLSLGVINLDLSISPDAFGLRAFDHEKPDGRRSPYISSGGRRYGFGAGRHSTCGSVATHRTDICA